MTDRPDAGELIEAVRGFLEAEVLPTLTEARLRYQMLVALHALAIVGRELPLREDYLRQDRAMLAECLGTPVTASELCLAEEVNSRLGALCSRIRAGDYDAPEASGRLARQLRACVVRKLRVANPRHPGIEGKSVV